MRTYSQAATSAFATASTSAHSTCAREWAERSRDASMPSILPRTLSWHRATEELKAQILQHLTSNMSYNRGLQETACGREGKLIAQIEAT